MPPGEDWLAAAVPVGVALFASLKCLLLFPVAAAAAVLAAEPPREGVPAPHQPHKISLRSLLQSPAMDIKVASHVSLL